MKGAYRLVFAAVAGMLLLAPSCPQGPNLDPWTPPPSAATTQRVVLFGDSISAMAESTALDLWVQDSNVSVRYQAVGGTQIQDWILAMANVTAEDTVVIALGSNNLLNVAWNTGETQANVDAALAEVAEAKRIVWVNINTTGAALHGDNYAQRVPWFNQYLQDATTSRPNMVVADWAASSDGRTDWLNLPDTIHYNAAGTVAYAQFLHDAAAL